METLWHNCLIEIMSIASVLAAVFSGLCAWLTYTLSAKIRDELKSDETVVVSRLIHPGLRERDHDKSVITCTLFNKSKRKVFVSQVKVFDRCGRPLAITWSNRINAFGMPQNPCELIGIVDTETLFVRRNDGKEIEFCRLEVRHSFSAEPVTAIFEPYEELVKNWEDQTNPPYSETEARCPQG